MSGRGRGRGGRGGRGGAAGVHPVAKDDEGKILKTEVEGPPPVFPEVDLPEPPTELPTEAERQLIRRHELTSFWKNSPFHLRAPQSTSGNRSAGDVERYTDRYRQAQHAEQPPLTSILTLNPHYFPEELFSTKQQMAAKSAAAQKAYWAAQQIRRAAAAAAAAAEAGTGARLGEDLTLGKQLDELAKRESRQRIVGGPGAEAGGGLDRAEGEEEGPPEAEVEEEEEYMEDDDYCQNEYFDDDEGYDDMDDGGDEGPIY